MPTQNFVHLHVHTCISVQDGLPSPTEYAKYARKMGFPAAAITDHGRMGGVVEFVDACRKPMDDVPPIKPIIGQEFYIVADHKATGIIKEDGTKGRGKNNHITLLAMNDIGYRNLLRASSIGATEGFYYKPRIDWNILKKYSEGVICLSGCMAGEVAQALINNREDEAEQIASKYKELFGDRYYIELQHHRIAEQKKILPKLKSLASKLDIKLVASNDVHYLRKDDWKVHDMLLEMTRYKQNKKSGEEKTTVKNSAYSTREFYLKSQEEMEIVFGKFCPESLTNTVELADRIEDFLQLNVPHLLPEANIPYNSDFEEWWQTYLPYNKKNDAYLGYLAMKGLHDLGLDRSPSYRDRLKYELKQIWFMGVTDYFLIQHELVLFLKAQDILYGVRGSGVGSLVGYALHIHPIDPMRWNLLFERFLNPGRGTQYLINYSCLPVKKWKQDGTQQDEDVSLERIQKLIESKKELEEYKPFAPAMEKELWVLENQGLAAYICDLADSNCTSKLNESQLWSAYFMGITDEQPKDELVISQVASLPDVDTDIDGSRRQEAFEWARKRFGEEQVSLIGTRGTYKARSAVTNALKVSEQFQADWGDSVIEKATEISKTIPEKAETIEQAIEESKLFAQWAKKYPTEIGLAEQLMGAIASTGVHAAGVLVSSRPIVESAPLERSKDVYCSGFDKKSVEKVGLVKYDYLGSKTFETLTTAIKLVEKRQHKKIDILDIPLDDPNVFKVYRSGLTSSIFQVGSAGMQEAIRDIGVDDIESLIAVIAMYRPGPMAYIPNYAAGKRNPESVKYSEDIIKQELSSTFGIIAYQEQAMFLARKMGKLTWGEVDKLRGAISKKEGKEFERSLNLLRSRALKNGYSEEVVKEVTSLMAEFGGYAFNKSHACSYAIESYWTAYFRTYFPSEWLASCMHVYRDNDDKIGRFKSECRKIGIKVLSPNVNDSGLETTVTSDGSIAMPLISLKGVGAMAQTIVVNQPFESVEDMVTRARPNRGMVKALIEGGALSCFPELAKIYGNEAIMEYYDSLVAERNYKEKQEAKRKREAEKQANKKYTVISPLQALREKKNDNGSKKKSVPVFVMEFSDSVLGGK